jgi:hypothetical protein
MNLSFRKTLTTFLITLMILPLGISRSLAVNSITTESFVSDLRTKIKDTHQINDENISIEWTDEALEKKFE